LLPKIIIIITQLRSHNDSPSSFSSFKVPGFIRLTCTVCILLAAKYKKVVGKWGKNFDEASDLTSLLNACDKS